MLDLQPDYLAILIGINDVWRQFDKPQMKQVDLASYSAKLDGLIQRTLPAVKGILVLSPFCRDQSRGSDARSNGRLRRGGQVACRTLWLARVTFVDVQAAFDAGSSINRRSNSAVIAFPTMWVIHYCQRFS